MWNFVCLHILFLLSSEQCLGVGPDDQQFWVDPWKVKSYFSFPYHEVEFRASHILPRALFTEIKATGV